MTVVKICGLTREEDVAAACALGAAEVGFNFVESSPRRVSISLARSLAAAVSPGVLRGGVFLEEPRQLVVEAVRQVPLDFLQLHRRVTGEDLDALGARISVAARVEEGRDALPAREILLRCKSLLWDSSAGGGRSPDWELLEEVGPLPIPVFLAGGLDAGNVADAIRRLRPAGVDVASGVESAPGVKDRGKLEAFFAAVRDADRG